MPELDADDRELFARALAVLTLIVASAGVLGLAVRVFLFAAGL